MIGTCVTTDPELQDTAAGHYALINSEISSNGESPHALCHHHCHAPAHCQRWLQQSEAARPGMRSQHDQALLPASCSVLPCLA